ncbi:MAG: FAD-dependent oxidoreductase [Rhodobiaceae bacterium]|nr:FAD-dependent oxidoreductase [Rhodobiaceae bacterium]MCC0017902.1 FAD-dependent oxidoreductase [Rhodobiaceae bacterium]MCC0051551.1 FAD-dependent oxidoreductase [Rhodobiaceae bacterium]MCC0062146.1 FAD-dependent oxidoreductase [Rhodobiaceae bacterium]
MSETINTDICVIGGGSGGLSVAAAAAAFGVPVVLVEKGKMGGDCLNYGCVPSKALIAAGKRAHAMRTASTFGCTNARPRVDYKAVHDHVHGVIAAIAPNDSAERFTGLGVRVIKAAARFINRNTVEAGNVTIRARRFVIATGSSPMVPPIPGLDKVRYLTNESFFDLKERPEHLLVIGGGPIGMELAQASRRLGSQVTVLEAFQPLGKDDPELAQVVLDKLAEEEISVRGGARVSGVRRIKAGIELTIETEAGEEKIVGSHLLVAAGRKANVEGLGLDEAGITHDRRGIKVGKGLKTTNRRVYAIGDVVGGLQFTHVANYHAGLVIRNALFRLPVKVETAHIPWATYTDPELAHVGMTEAMAREKKKRIHVLRWPYAENDRAQAERETSGFIKVVTDAKGRILGATIVGAHAGELIQMWGFAILNAMKIGAMTSFVSPYPTLTEIGKRAAINYYKPSLTNPWLQRMIRFVRWLG